MPRIPGINHQDAVRALQKVGFRIARQGKHIVMTDGVRIMLVSCRLAVEAHGGRIRADSAAPRGAVFSFTLPATG